MNELDAFALTTLKQGSVVFDVGAGTGEFTRAALARGASVIAVEPSEERCQKLGTADRLTVVHTAVGSANGTAKYVGRVRRTLSTNARDAVRVPISTLDSVAESKAVAAVDVLRIRAAGNLEDALTGASHLVANAKVIRLVGDAVLGDDASVLSGLVTRRPLVTATVAGVMPWSDDRPFVPSRIDWLTGIDLTGRTIFTEDDVAALVFAEGRSPDATRRTRLARVLQSNPQLYEYPYPLPHITDVLDELALDPDPTTWRAAAWWRDHLNGYDHLTRNARRQAAFERQVDHLTGPRPQRPSPFPHLT
jgi:FkbM family methyltransferase